jgi:arsenite methyltransferase
MSSDRYFEAVAEQWDEMRQGFFSEAVREKACAAAGVAPGEVAADLGAGTGFLTEALLARGLRVIAVDPVPAMLEEIRRKHPEAPGLELRRGGLERLPLSDGEVDHAFANMVLHHVEDPPAAIREIARVLRPGGRLTLTDLDAHDHQFLRSEQHDRWLGFRRQDLAAWLKAAGFEEVSVVSADEGCCSSSECGEERAQIGVVLASARRPAAVVSPAVEEQDLRQAIRDRYARAALQATAQRASCCGDGDASCTSDPITGDLYGAAELAELPETARLASLGCGNPTALAELRPGEVVLDLGAGGGIDVLLSARRVGPSGKAYGLDMTEEMLALARRNQTEAGVENAEFLQGEIEEVPLPDGSVDVVLSNCVINLSTDKDRVFREALRVLRPGGRLAVADMVATGALPPAVRRVVELWSGCLGGALEIDDYRRRLRAAGFEEVAIEVTRTFGPELLPEALRAQIEGFGVELSELSGRLASAFVRARKPAVAESTP